MRLLGVIRLSRESEETTSPARQRAAIEQWAAAEGHRIVGWAEDLDVSGKVPPAERPELGPWLKKMDQWDAIIVHKPDRLSRSLRDFLNLWHDLNEHSKALVSIEPRLDFTTPEGRLMAGQLYLIAEYERELTATRVRGAKRHIRQGSGYAGGHVPFGYMVVPRGKHWAYAHDPELAPVVREMVARVLSGVPMRQIRIWLNDLGIPTPRNAARRRNGHTEKAVEWSTQSVKEVLTNPAIYGVMTENGKPLRDVDGEVIHRCEGIIDRQEWEQVKRAISHPGHTYRVDANPLLGIAFCHLCGEPLYTTFSTGRRGTKYEYYRCARAKRDGDCPSKNIPSVPLIQRAVEIFLGQAGKLEWGHWKIHPAEDHGYEIAEVKQELADLDDEYAAGRLHKTTYARMTHRLEERLETLQDLPSVPESEELIGHGITYAQRFQGLTGAERAAEMREAGFKLFVSQTDKPDGFTVRFQIRDYFVEKARKS